MAGSEDRGDFGRVMIPHMDVAYALARYLTRNPSAAEDVVQEAYLRAFRGFAGWRGDNAKAWLLAIVRRCFLDSLSRVTPFDGASGGPATAEDPEARLAEKSEAAMLRGLIEALPRPHREAIVLRECNALSYREIAEVTGVPVGTVMSRLHRARQILAQRLEAMREDALQRIDA